MKQGPLIADSVLALIVLVCTASVLYVVHHLHQQQRLRDREIQRQTLALRDELATQGKEMAQVRDHLDTVLTWVGWPTMPSVRTGAQTEPRRSESDQRHPHLKIIKGGRGITTMLFAGIGDWALHVWSRHRGLAVGATTLTASAAVAAMLTTTQHPQTTPIATGPAKTSSATATSTTAPKPPASYHMTVAPTALPTTGGQKSFTRALTPADPPSTSGSDGFGTPQSLTSSLTKPTGVTTAPTTAASVPALPTTRCGVALTVVVLQVGVLCP
jgi:hypothetical protein